MTDMPTGSNVFYATRFDGRSAAGERVALVIEGRELAVMSGEVTDRFPIGEVGVSERFDRAPHMLSLPGGVTLEVPDPARRFEGTLAAAGVRESWVVRMQHAWAAVAIALFALVGGIVWLYVHGVPVVSRVVAEALPASLEQRLGDGVLAILDEHRLRPSRLSPDWQARLDKRFHEAAAVSAPGVDVRLLFRSGPVNAFALPGGTIVVFDGLLEQVKSDDEILGVLGHELGHVVHRHSTRQLVQALGIGAIAALLWGDFSTVVANVPLVLGVMRYGRGFEEEADRFAIEFLHANGLSAQGLVDFFERLERDTPSGRVRADMPDFLSSHPETGSRLERLRRAVEAEHSGRRQSATATRELGS